MMRYLSVFFAAVYIVLLQAAAVARTLRGCSDSNGVGSPPCDKAYRGSGHVRPPPPPGGDGKLFPACTCPFPDPGFPPRAAGPAPAPVAAAGPAPAPAAMIRRGEVEVLTVDVRLANKVRCNNASLAKDVAKLLKIPVKRVTVTPWSWTMDVPQGNYLAFVQEDHERCDCKAEDGKVVRGGGFRKVKRDTVGAAVTPQRAVMTVSEYNAMLAGLKKQALTTAAAVGPPPARVQMLTRDPCLVYLLRKLTQCFRKILATMLGVPMNKLIIDPPPVQGTVGLLQLSSSVHSQSDSQQAPFLAVNHCPSTEAAALEKRLRASFLSASASGSPSPAPAPGPAPDYMVESSDGSSLANDTEHIALSMRLSNIHYDEVASNWTLVDSLSTVIRSAIAASGHVTADAVHLSLFPGSLVIEATIAPPAGTECSAVLAFLDGTVCDQTAQELNALTILKPFTYGTIDCTVGSLSLRHSPVSGEEVNRPWIAFWSVSILPPFAEKASWNLLNLANTQGTEVSKLLPQTLARVPGMKYRSLEEPNAVNETRLPPPEDKAVGFRVPDPVDREYALKKELARMKSERDAAALRLKMKSALEIKKAQAELSAAHRMSQQLQNADATFTQAARVHAKILQAAGPNSTQVEAPDIMSYDVIKDPDGEDGDSPYYWPEKEALSLAEHLPAVQSQLRGRKA